MGLFDWTVQKTAPTEKLNPAQSLISGPGESSESSYGPSFTYHQFYEQLEVVNRSVNMIVDDVAAIPIAIGEQNKGVGNIQTIKKKTLDRLLNVEPNPYQDINSFRRSMIMDLLLDGNIFLYYDGQYLYTLPATRVLVVSDPKTYIKEYKFDGQSISYEPNEIIHIKDNSYRNIWRGSSRLEPGLRTMRLIMAMRQFQDNFFKNGAVPGLVLKTDNILNQRLKDRLTLEWSQKYKPQSGGKKPIILDGGLSVDAISNVSFQDLDFQNSIIEAGKEILKMMGIPPLLYDSQKAGDLRPNLRLYYLETIIPIVDKINSAFSRFFGFDIYEDTTYVEALRPELKDQALFLQGLVNSGIITPNEARDELGKPALPGHDDLRIPQNIAGSAANPSLGGAPEKDPEGGNNDDSTN